MGDVRYGNAVGFLLLLVCVACVPMTGPATASAPTVRFFSRNMPIGRGTLELHLASSGTDACQSPLVLYVSGDGGWFGTAVEMFRQLAATGCPTVGFSARSFLKIDRPDRQLARDQLTADYKRVIVEARRDLDLQPSTPVVLTGWSRGAAFAVLTAPELSQVDRVAGVVAVGLAAGEDLTVNGPEDETDDGPSAISTARSPYEPYRMLSGLREVPAAVIQATGDDYLPAAAARTLFGPDTPDHRLYEVEARNHRFSGAKATFNRTLREALQWVLSSDRPTGAR